MWLPWEGRGYCGAVAVLESIGQSLRLLSELIRAFALGGKGGRTCAPTRFGASLATHLCRMVESAVLGVQSVAGTQTGLLND